MLKPFLKDRQGNFYLDESLRYVKGGWLVPAPNQNPITTQAASVAGQPFASPPVVFEGSQDAYSEVFAAVGQHGATDDPDVTARLQVEITDTIYQRRLMNRPVLADHVFGTNLRPFQLCESLWLEPQQTFLTQFFNLSANGDSHFSQQWERRIFQTPVMSKPNVVSRIKENQIRKKRMYPFWLTTDMPVNIPAGGQIDALFTVTKDIRVVIFGSMCRSLVGGSLNTVDDVTATFFDPWSDRPIQNQPVIGTVASGTSTFPYWLPTGWMIEPNTAIRARFMNTAFGANEIFWTFFGVACKG